MRKIAVGAIISLCVLLSSCSSDADKAEISRLKEENESLRAAIETVSQEETTTATLEQTQVPETTTTTVETTTTIATTPALTKDEVQNVIAIAGAKITKINSADGVDVKVFWRNNSDKDIKYITFKLEIYNAVNDVIADSISGKSVFNCQLTGPVEPFQNIIDSIISGEDTLEYLWCSYNMDDVIYDDNLGLCYCGPNIDPSTGVRERFAIPVEDYDIMTTDTEWETIMYNKTANTVKIIGVSIEYMDGTTFDLSEEDVELAYIS